MIICVKNLLLYVIKMHRMKKLLVIVSLILVQNSLLAQKNNYKLDFGARAGVANYLGDIGGGDIARPFIVNLEMKDTRWSTGAFVRYKFHTLFAYQGAFTYARIQGADSESDNYARRGRNLSFRNDVLTLDNKLEFYPPQLTMTDVGKRGKYRTDFKTYLFVGLGAFYHNPKTLYQGNYVALRPLMTEGVSYSKFALSIPFGSGVYFTYRKQHRFGFEVSAHMSFTDYLDDVSGVYVEAADMADDPLAATLANRNPELDYTLGEYPAPENYGVKIPGQVNPNQRGGSSAPDSFIMLTLSYSYVIKSSSGFNRSYNWIYRSKSRFGRTKARF